MPLKSLTQGLEIGFKHAKSEVPEILELANPGRKEFYLSALLLALPLVYYGVTADNSSTQANNYSSRDGIKR